MFSTQPIRLEIVATPTLALRPGTLQPIQLTGMQESAAEQATWPPTQFGLRDLFVVEINQIV